MKINNGLLPFIAGLLTMAICADAKFMRPDVENVPTDRLIANLQAKLKESPNDVQIAYALARVHAIAFAKHEMEVQVYRKSGLPFFGFIDQGLLPREIKPPANIAASNHLAAAINYYAQALKIKPDHLPSLVGLGWCQEKAGLKKEATQTYRKALEEAWSKEKPAGVFGSSVTAEIADYLLPLLDPQTDAAEIKRVQEIKQSAQRLPRSITPILIPLADGLPLDQLVDQTVGVPFDLDGSGQMKKWSWPTPKAGWLAYDPDASGSITSGLQLFGARTFWVFWENGFETLSALDDDQDGWLRGKELQGIVIWQDINCNGRSEPGEVRPLSDYGITGISCGSETHSTGIPWNPRGLEFRGSEVRPIYDYISISR